MSRILLADDSPHAQRMGELILREEGYEVVTVTDGATVLVRLRDVNPDVILVSVRMPTRNGYEICDFIKKSPRHQHARVVLTIGISDDVEDQERLRVGADGVVKKPFEASLLLATVNPLMAAAVAARGGEEIAPEPEPEPVPVLPEPVYLPPDPAMVRAAVTIALDAAMQDMIDRVTGEVLAALNALHAASSKTHESTD
ncbi:MAG: response regulator [Bryobacteraceae bacterium]